MSWSVTAIGKPEKVSEYLESYKETITGPSRKEYEEAMPHLQALVLLSMGSDKVVQLNASGHASFDSDGKKTYSNIAVTIGEIYGKLLL